MRKTVHHSKSTFGRLHFRFDHRDGLVTDLANMANVYERVSWVALKKKTDVENQNSTGQNENLPLTNTNESAPCTEIGVDEKWCENAGFWEISSLIMLKFLRVASGTDTF